VLSPSTSIEHTYLWCPACCEELVYAYSTCGDDDPECDCDEAYDCKNCGRRWMVACGAHVGEKWVERQTISRDEAKKRDPR
jgi:hypothetical protein